MNTFQGIERGAMTLDNLIATQHSRETDDLSSRRGNVLTETGSSHLHPLKVIDLHDFISLEIVPRAPILGPWLMTQSLNMIYGWRGVGKTHVSLGVAYAVACGTKFLNWTADKPRRVLLLDGEMPAVALQERLAAISATNDIQPDKKFLSLVTPDLQTGIMPDLSTYRGQEAVDGAIEQSGAEPIIVDNLSCLVRGNGRENDAESWTSVSEWGLSQRQRSRSVLFIHHAGKGGQQRGTSKREDLLDVVISLRRPPDYDPTIGACFEVHFEKARHMYGNDTTPIEATLTTDTDGLACWAFRLVEDTTFDRVVELANQDLTQRDIASELGLSRSTVSRAWHKADDAGMLEKKNSAKGNNQYTKRGKVK
jgi:hypothetical protein